MQATERRMGERARDLRHVPTPFEKILWSRLSRSQLAGYKFRRQTVIGPYICDFFCPAKGLIVEVDGDTHERAKDAVRDTRLLERGFPTIRFSNADVGQNLDGVLGVILAKLGELPDRWNRDCAGPSITPGPTPTPPLKGRGSS